MISYEEFVLMTDMDGTLIGSDQRVSEQNKAAIRRFTERGGSFGVATGRTQNNCAPYMEGLTINTPCIFYNGGALFDWQEKVFIKTRHLAVPRLDEFVAACMTLCPTLCAQVYTDEIIYVVSLPENDDAVMVREKQQFVYRSLAEVAALPWIKVLLCDRKENLLKCRALAEDFGVAGRTLNFFSSPTYLEFVGDTVSKGHMLAELRALPAYAGKKFVAAGDFYNDIEMLRRADCGVASGNAEPEVKAAADVVGVHCDDDLIASIIGEIIPQRFGLR